MYLSACEREVNLYGQREGRLWQIVFTKYGHHDISYPTCFPHNMIYNSSYQRRVCGPSNLGRPVNIEEVMI